MRGTLAGRDQQIGPWSPASAPAAGKAGLSCSSEAATQRAIHPLSRCTQSWSPSPASWRRSPVPSTKSCTKRAKFAEVVAAIQPYKAGVESCYQSTGALSGCSTGGSNGVPADATTATWRCRQDLGGFGRHRCFRRDHRHRFGGGRRRHLDILEPAVPTSGSAALLWTGQSTSTWQGRGYRA
jgi:hypothetical protein